MKIAIIGSGISGLTAAHYLRERHNITVFEANAYIGGHTNTLDVELEGERHRIDTGFIVFNDWTYPNFIRLLDEIGVPSQPTDMSFSVRCDLTGLEYKGSNLNGLFSQRRNLLRPGFYRMLRDILRFNRESLALLELDHEQLTIGEYVRQAKYSREFVDHYLFPMGSAIWSCPSSTFALFPIRFVVEFYRNHGLLSVMKRPVWRVIQNGSRTYVDTLTRPFRDRIILNCPVQSVRRSVEGVEVHTLPRGTERFEHVIFACHSDQALRMLGDPSATETELLGAFPYESNLAVLHTDSTVLPLQRRAWAAWNYHVQSAASDKATVTYNMNMLQGLHSRHVFCVTLNGEEQINPQAIIQRIVYQHPIFTTRRAAAQRRHHELIDSNDTSFCGAYWGNGFHEDGVNSALAVCQVLNARPRRVALLSET